ncbi:ABC transporter permease [Agromyces bauzanensis]
MDETSPDPESRQQREARIATEPFNVINGRPGWFAGTTASYGFLWSYRELLMRLVKREVKVRYKDSSLGLLWSLFRPLIQLAIYYFAIGQVLGAARGTPDFGIFVFIGLTFWTLFSEIVAGGTTSIVSNAGLVKKVNIPREVFPLAATGSAIVNFVIQLVVLLGGIFLLSHFRVSWELLYAPIAFLTIVAFGVGLGLLTSALNVYLRDVQHFVEIYLLIFFWLSPVVYPYTFVHNALQGNWLEQLYLANPVTIAIVAAQKALWAAGSEDVGGVVQAWPDELELRLLIMLAIGLLFVWISQRVFARLQGNFAQEL